MKNLPILLLLCAGCATTPVYPRIDYVQPFLLMTIDGKAMYPRRGTCYLESRTIQVQWEAGTDHPDFYALGHEVWHLPELGGRFHK